jgi:ABC-type spermidine/putrescine transport system permease subunit II
MPLAIYSAAAGGDRPQAEIMVVIFTVLSGLFLYVANKLTKRLI